MYSVTVCVVLVLFGNVSSFVISRTRRDLDKIIFDIYGPPSAQRPQPREMHRHPHHMPSLKPDRSMMRDEIEDPKMYISQDVLESIFGPPLQKPSPGAESSAPRLYSAVTDRVNNTRRKEGKDIADIFGSPPSEVMTATENSIARSKKVPFENEDRFLSEPLLIKQWEKNREKSETDIKKHNEKPQESTRKHPEPSEPGKDREHPEHEPFGHGRDSMRHDPVPLGIEPFASKPLEPKGSERRPDFRPLEPIGSKPRPDPRSLEPRDSEPRPDPRPFEPRGPETRPDPRSLEHIPTSTSPTNASNKNFAFNSLLLVLTSLSLGRFVFS